MPHDKNTVKARLKELGYGTFAVLTMPINVRAIARELRDDETIQAFLYPAEVDSKKGVLIATEKRVVFRGLLRNEEIPFSKISSVSFQEGFKGYIEFAASGHNLKVKTAISGKFADYVRQKIG